jgi:hypothetical protein
MRVHAAGTCTSAASSRRCAHRCTTAARCSVSGLRDRRPQRPAVRHIYQANSGDVQLPAFRSSAISQPMTRPTEHVPSADEAAANRALSARSALLLRRVCALVQRAGGSVHRRHPAAAQERLHLLDVQGPRARAFQGRGEICDHDTRRRSLLCVALRAKARYAPVCGLRLTPPPAQGRRTRRSAVLRSVNDIVHPESPTLFCSRHAASWRSCSARRQASAAARAAPCTCSPRSGAWCAFGVPIR